MGERVVPCPAVYVAACDPSKSTVFNSTFNRVAATVTRCKYCHVMCLWKSDEHRAMGWNSSICWGGKGYVVPEEFTVQCDEGSGQLWADLATWGRVDLFPVEVDLLWDVGRLLRAAEVFVGMDYDKQGAVCGTVGGTLLARKQDSETRGSTFCSEMVVHLLVSACDKAAPKRESAMTPDDVVNMLK
jgi:hypothetical protein